MPLVALDVPKDPLDTKVAVVAEAAEARPDEPPVLAAPPVAAAPMDAPLSMIVVWYIVIVSLTISVNQEEYEEHVNV